MGNILQVLDQVTPAEDRSFTYDALQRLKTGGTTATPETYDHDLVGNRTTSFLSSTHNHNGANRLLEDDQFTYTYDANGNLETKTSKTTPTDVTTFTWNAQDQLIQINFPGGASTTYKYDGLGRRIEKNVNGSVARYVYDDEDLFLEYDGTNTFVSRYSHGDQTDQPLAVQRAGLGFFYYQVDHQGSIRNLTDSSGVIANSYVYDSYGRTLTVSESIVQPFTYTGREFNAESGLYYYRARYYDSSTGRFLSEDPILFSGRDQNLYRYVTNNPMNFIDPSGLLNLFVSAGGSAVVGAGVEGSVGVVTNLDFLFDRTSSPNLAGFVSTSDVAGGFNVSSDLPFVGVTTGSLTSFQSPTSNVNLVAFGISVTLISDLKSGEFLGLTVGGGPGVPFDFSASQSNTDLPFRCDVGLGCTTTPPRPQSQGQVLCD